MVAGFTLMALAAILLGGTALAVLRSTLQRQEQLVTEYLGEVVLTEELVSASHRGSRQVRDYLLTGEEDVLVNLEAVRALFFTRLEQLETGKVLPEERPLLERVRAARERVLQAADKAIAARRNGSPPEALSRQVVEELQPAREALDESLEALTVYEQRLYRDARRESERASGRALWLLGAGFLGTLVAALALSAYLVRVLRQRERAEAERLQLLERERAAYRAVEERQALLDLIIEQSGDAIIMADAQGVLRIFNAEAERLHGVTRREVAAPEWTATFGLLTPDGRDLPLEETPLYRALQGERVAQGRCLVRCPDGRVRTLSNTASPLHRPDGSLAGAVITARDETERLALERQRAETLAQLDALFASTPVGLAFVDRELRYQRINDTLAALNGSPAAAHLGRTVRELLPQDADLLEPLLRRVLETGVPVLGHELAVPHLDGQSRHLLLSYYPVRDDRGTPLGVGAAVVDVTRIKRAEEELRRTAEFRERFLGILGHDLRNPLNAIMLSTDVLLRTECLQERELKAVRRIDTSADRMMRMIGELLDFTRGRLGGGIPVEPRPGDLAPLCREVVEELEASHPGAQLAVQVRGHGRGEWDAGRLAQVVSNLVGNAIRYSPEGSPIRVTVDGRAEDAVVLSVHNTGAPIPPELLPELFEPFRRGTHSDGGSHGGLGLGLYIVQQIVQAHGGTLQADSHAESGTTFTTRLPRYRPRASRPALVEAVSA